MQVSFNYDQAIATEKLYREAKNYNGLIQISIEFWENFGSIHTFSFRFPILCFFFGRIREIEGLKTFIEKYSSDLMLIQSNREILVLGNKLFEIGYNFPNLQEKDLIELERYYCDHEYYDIIEFILFEQSLLKRPLKKFDISLKNIRNSAFSESFVMEIFNSLVRNLEKDDYEYEELEMYNRANNTIVSKLWNERIPKVEFLILDFITVRKLLDSSKAVWGIEFYDSFRNVLINKRFEIDKLESYFITTKILDFFNELVASYFNSLPSNLIEEKLKEYRLSLTKEWLTEINK